MLHSILGGKVEVALLLPSESGPAAQAALLAHMQQTASSTNPVSVGVRWGKDATGAANHVVLVTGVDAKQVTLLNPQSDQETLTLTEFLARFREAEFVGDGVVAQDTSKLAQAQ